MLLSKTCEYALRAALYVASAPPTATGYLAVREISDALSIPYAFLAKLVQPLAQAGLLQTQRGPLGGVALGRPADQIRLDELVVAVDGPGLFEACALGLPGCGDRTPCPLHEAWAPARADIHRMFAATTLADLAARLRADRLRLAPADPA